MLIFSLCPRSGRQGLKQLNFYRIIYFNLNNTSQLVVPRCAIKKVFWKVHLCQRLFFNKVAGSACNFIKERLQQSIFFRASAFIFFKIIKKLTLLRTIFSRRAWDTIFNFRFFYLIWVCTDWARILVFRSSSVQTVMTFWTWIGVVRSHICLRTVVPFHTLVTCA